MNYQMRRLFISRSEAGKITRLFSGLYRVPKSKLTDYLSLAPKVLSKRLKKTVKREPRYLYTRLKYSSH